MERPNYTRMVFLGVMCCTMLGDLITVKMKEHQENKTQIKGHENSPRLCSDTEFIRVSKIQQPQSLHSLSKV